MSDKEQEKRDVNSYFRQKFGTDDLQEVQDKLAKLREDGLAEPATHVVTVKETKEVQKPVSLDFDDNLVVGSAQDRTQAEMDAAVALQEAHVKEAKRSREMIEGEEAYALAFGMSLGTTSWPKPTLAEVRAKAGPMPVNGLKDAVASIDGQIKAYTGAKEARRKIAEIAQRTLYGYPDQSPQKEKIASEVEEVIRGYTEIGAFDKMLRAVPHLEQLKALYQEILTSKVKATIDQNLKRNETLKRLTKFSKEADKLFPRIEKLSTEYQLGERENVLARLAVIVEQYQIIQGVYYDLKSQLRLLDPQPQYPPLRDLPVMPIKLWKKMEQAEHES